MNRIVSGEQFKPGVLSGVLADMEAVPKPAILQPEILEAEAIVNVRAAEEAALRANSSDADRLTERARNKVQNSLLLNPADSFFWLELYSVEVARNGLDPKYIRYLERSYQAGPLEGWIALRRNKVALAVFSMLGERTKNEVIREFAGMVDADCINEAATALLGVGWPFKEQLLASLEKVDMSSRQNLSKRVLAEGVSVSIPGVKTNDRPWQ